jgi:hypothetical protein
MLKTIDSYNNILTNFPKIELSYETMAHNKVYDSDVILAIPEGSKMIAWFTEYNDEPVCFIFQLDPNLKNINIVNNLKNIQIAVTSFNDSLVYGQGTILHGTIFKYNDISCFSIEDIYYYKGRDVSSLNYLTKLQTIQSCLQKDLSSTALTNKYIIFGLPIMNNNFSLLLNEISLLPYKISTIQYRFLNSKKILFIKYYKPKTTQNTDSSHTHSVKCDKAVFKVSPQIQTDIYNLFVYKDGKEEFYDIAFIPDYATSVLMNKLFRNIKENYNLDALEESDDEKEFENEKEDKYVFLDRYFKMNCQYNYKFKKWVPLSLAAKDSRIITTNNL